MLEEYFASSSTLHRNERVKLAAMFWKIVGAGMFIGGVAGAFFYEGPLFWSRVGIAVLGIVLALIFQRVRDREHCEATAEVVRSVLSEFVDEFKRTHIAIEVNMAQPASSRGNTSMRSR